MDVLAIALTPSSIASKPSACQSRQRVRSDPKRQKPPSAHRMYFSSQRHADLGVSSCSLLNHAHVAIVSFFFFCLHLLCHFRFAPFAPETTRSVSKHTRNTPRFSNYPTVRRRPYRNRTQLRTPVFRTLPSGLNFRAASRLRSVSSLRGLNDACAGRRLVDLCF